MNRSHREIERAARESYGRLIAFLVATTGDLPAAEDALSDAFTAALTHWPTEGVPDQPEAWLLVTARRKVIDQARRRQTALAAQPVLARRLESDLQTVPATEAFPDERLKLFFLCAHPAIDPSIRTPLMLQTGLGLSAATIASAFLVTPATMGQRLSRAKTKIRSAQIGFRVPTQEELPARLAAVLETIYSAFTLGWEGVGETAAPGGPVAGQASGQLTEEAIWLGRAVVQLLPQSAEATGLLALMLFCESRRVARRDAAGEFIPLSRQDPTLWSEHLIAEAEGLLARGAALQELGPFQLEAAIQSVHAQRRVTGTTNWTAIAQLYQGLVLLAPTSGAWLGRAAAVAEVEGPDAGLALLRELPGQQFTTYQPYWALVAHLLYRSGRHEPAQAALMRAIGLTEQVSVRRFLQARWEEWTSSSPETATQG